MDTVNTAKQIIERIEQCNDMRVLYSWLPDWCRGIRCFICPMFDVPRYCGWPLLMLKHARKFLREGGV